MKRYALIALLVFLPAAARSEGTTPADSAMMTPAVSSGSVTAIPGGSAPPPETPRPPSHYAAPDSALMRSLGLGGYVLVFRHGKTDWAQRDTDLTNMADRAGQRNLSEEGRRLMTGVGNAIAALGIPIGSVTASPMWRCRDTATLAFGHCDTTTALFQRGGEYRAVRMKLLSTPPAPGKNAVIVTHQDVLLPILHLQREELGEGEALVVKPLGDGKFDVVAQVTPAQWDAFAARLQSKWEKSQKGVKLPPSKKKG